MSEAIFASVSQMVADKAMPQKRGFRGIHAAYPACWIDKSRLEA